MNSPASLGVVLREEALIDLGLLDEAVANRRVLDLRDLSLSAMSAPELDTDRIPEGARVIDLRAKPAFADWHWPDAVRLDLPEALRLIPALDRSVEYVLYCEFGLLSAHLAELMQREGLRAHHVRGGLRAVKSLAAQAGRRDS